MLLLETLLNGGKERDRVRIHGAVYRMIGAVTGYGCERGAGVVESGEGVPPAEALADRKRGADHDLSGAHEVDRDVSARGFYACVIKDGHSGGGGMVGVVDVDQQVVQRGVPDVEQVQPGLAPAQEPRCGGVVEIARCGDDRGGGGGWFGRGGVGCGVGGGMALRHHWPLVAV